MEGRRSRSGEGEEVMAAKRGFWRVGARPSTLCPGIGE